VHHLVTHDLAAEHLADALMPEADPEDRHVRSAPVGARQTGDEALADPGVLGRPGPGEISTPSGSNAIASSSDKASLRTTTGSAPSWPTY